MIGSVSHEHLVVDLLDDLRSERLRKRAINRYELVAQRPRGRDPDMNLNNRF